MRVSVVFTEFIYRKTNIYKDIIDNVIHIKIYNVKN